MHLMKNSTTSPLTCMMLGAILVTLWVAGCKPEPEGDLGDPYDKVVGLYGTWELQSVFQSDEVKDFLDDANLSSFYIDGITPPMTLTVEDNGRFAVSMERGKNFFGNQGTWEINNPEFPSYLSMTQTDVFGNVIDSLQADLGNVVRPHDNTMALEIRRFCGHDDDYPYPVTYIFNFIRN